MSLRVSMTAYLGETNSIRVTTTVGGFDWGTKVRIKSINVYSQENNLVSASWGTSGGYFVYYVTLDKRKQLETFTINFVYEKRNQYGRYSTGTDVVTVTAARRPGNYANNLRFFNTFLEQPLTKFNIDADGKTTFSDTLYDLNKTINLPITINNPNISHVGFCYGFLDNNGFATTDQNLPEFVSLTPGIELLQEVIDLDDDTKCHPNSPLGKTKNVYNRKVMSVRIKNPNGGQWHHNDVLPVIKLRLPAAITLENGTERDTPDFDITLSFNLPPIFYRLFGTNNISPTNYINVQNRTDLQTYGIHNSKVNEFKSLNLYNPNTQAYENFHCDYATVDKQGIVSFTLPTDTSRNALGVPMGVMRSNGTTPVMRTFDIISVDRNLSMLFEEYEDKAQSNMPCTNSFNMPDYEFPKVDREDLILNANDYKGKLTAAWFDLSSTTTSELNASLKDFPNYSNILINSMKVPVQVKYKDIVSTAFSTNYTIYEGEDFELAVSTDLIGLTGTPHPDAICPKALEYKAGKKTHTFKNTSDIPGVGIYKIENLNLFAGVHSFIPKWDKKDQEKVQNILVHVEVTPKKEINIENVKDVIEIEYVKS